MDKKATEGLVQQAVLRNSGLSYYFKFSCVL